MKYIIATILITFGVLTYFMMKRNAGNQSVNVSKSDRVEIVPAKNPPSENGNKELGIIQKWDMPDDLLEISDLSFIDQDNLACVQDEAGIIYTYNLKSGKITNEKKFEKKGDFEGITIVGTTAWVVRSDGELFEINNYTSDNSEVSSFKTGLTSKENIEGLCYDKNNNRLLLSVKDRDKNSKDFKGIYAFDLVSKKLNEEPVYRIQLDDPIFDKSSKKSKDEIRPSALSINPTNGNIYVLDGPNAHLLILGVDNKGKQLLELDKKLNPQAEGITFSPEGKMYISNEGSKKMPGNILEVSLN